MRGTQEVCECSGVFISDIIDCKDDSCNYHGRCTDGVNTYTCACEDGWINGDPVKQQKCDIRKGVCF